MKAVSLPPKADEGTIRGEQEIVACDCWFSSTGKTIPRFIKYQDKEGLIHSIYEIEVCYSEKKRYCGIFMVEYSCRAVINNRVREFRLLFQPEACQWKIIWKKE